MDLLKYLEPMKNLPERFSNLAFWRGVRKLKDEVVNAFEYVDSWGKSIETKLANFQIISNSGPLGVTCGNGQFSGIVEIVEKNSNRFVNVHINTNNFTATLENAKSVKYGFLTLNCHIVKTSGYADVPIKISAQFFSPGPNVIVAIPTENFASYDISDVSNVTTSSTVSISNVTINYFT